MKLYNQYIQDCLHGKVIIGQNAMNGILRHVSDLEKSKDADYPYYFDEVSADNFINFVKACKLSGDKFQGKPFPVQPFQAFYYAMVYGWKKKSDNLRRFRRVYWCTARKSAKSEMTAPECLYHLISQPGKTQICVVATTFVQAKYIYDPCKYMATELKKDFEDANEILKTTQYEIKNTRTLGYITRLTADHKTNDGAGIMFGCVDEYHAHDDDTMVGVVSTSQGTSDEPILKIVTTAGFNKSGPDFKLRKHCVSVLNGTVKDDRLFTMIYDMDEGDDWEDPNNWYKPNPMLGITPTMDFMEQEYLKAKNEGGEALVQFQTKNLNMYTDAASVWVDPKIYNSCANFKTREELAGKYCVIGVDLASEHDTTAVNYLFPKQDGLEKPYYFTDYYCPAPKFKVTRVDGVFYSDFLPDWMTKTPGDVIDKDCIKADILRNAELFEVKMIGFDPYKAVDLMTELEKLGLPCGKVAQSASVLGSGNHLWKELILGRKIEHDGSPVTAWQMGNVEMYTDGNGNQKIVKGKGKTENKVDGPVAISNSFVAYLDLIRTDEEEELTVEDLGII